jgi:dTMP kinase
MKIRRFEMTQEHPEPYYSIGGKATIEPKTALAGSLRAYKMIPLDTSTLGGALPTQISKRGAFVLLEGVDRCGKTTQCARLVQRLVTAGLAATAMRFPDRTTSTGAIINNYLQKADMQLDDHAIHLLFSANRWESVPALKALLLNGTTVVCDRYAYSGVAFSAAKINEETGEPILDFGWCQAPDRGLPAPDCVIFLDLTMDEAEQRGGYVTCQFYSFRVIRTQWCCWRCVMWVAEIDTNELFDLSRLFRVDDSALGLVGNAMKSVKCRAEFAKDLKIYNASMRDVFHGRL